MIKEADDVYIINNDETICSSIWVDEPMQENQTPSFSEAETISCLASNMQKIKQIKD